MKKLLFIALIFSTIQQSNAQGGRQQSVTNYYRNPDGSVRATTDVRSISNGKATTAYRRTPSTPHAGNASARRDLFSAFLVVLLLPAIPYFESNSSLTKNKLISRDGIMAFLSWVTSTLNPSAVYFNSTLLTYIDIKTRDYSTFSVDRLIVQVLIYLSYMYAKSSYEPLKRYDSINFVMDNPALYYFLSDFLLFLSSGIGQRISEKIFGPDNSPKAKIKRALMSTNFSIFSEDKLTRLGF